MNVFRIHPESATPSHWPEGDGSENPKALYYDNTIVSIFVASLHDISVGYRPVTVISMKSKMPLRTSVAVSALFTKMPTSPFAQLSAFFYTYGVLSGTPFLVWIAPTTKLRIGKSRRGYMAFIFRSNIRRYVLPRCGGRPPLVFALTSPSGGFFRYPQR